MTETKTNAKKSYEKPQVQSYQSTDVLSGLGPALAIYGETGPNP
jgi:hypothetical protein